MIPDGEEEEKEEEEEEEKSIKSYDRTSDFTDQKPVRKENLSMINTNKSHHLPLSP